MSDKSKEKIIIGWCDNGLVDGKFTAGLVQVILNANNNGLDISGAMNVQGNQIGNQRQILFDKWADSTDVDWLLWIDSDVSVSIDLIKKLWDTADKNLRPIVSGIYFISKSTDDVLMQPFPAIFTNIDERTLQYIHPLPENQVIKIDSAGMGLVLMHKSIVSKLRIKFPNQSLFAEKPGIGRDFVGEDIAFFRKVNEAGIPVHAHTGAIAKHIKRFPLDANYYSSYWNSLNPE